MTVIKTALALTAASLLAIAPALAETAGSAMKPHKKATKSGAMMKKAPSTKESGTPTATGGPVGGKINKN